MNRRRVLQFVGVSATVGLAGCIDGVKEHFGLQGIVPIEIHNEGDRTHNLHLEAHEYETRRKSYEQSYSVTPNETVGPPHLDQAEQNLRIARIDENDEEAEVRAVSITPNTTLVKVLIYDDDLTVEVQQNEDGENETVDGDENQTADTDGNETDDADGE